MTVSGAIIGINDLINRKEKHLDELIKLENNLLKSNENISQLDSDNQLKASNLNQEMDKLEEDIQNLKNVLEELQSENSI